MKRIDGKINYFLEFSMDLVLHDNLLDSLHFIFIRDNNNLDEELYWGLKYDLINELKNKKTNR
jgi:hypothetical protein